MSSKSSRNALTARVTENYPANDKCTANGLLTLGQIKSLKPKISVAVYTTYMQFLALTPEDIPQFKADKMAFRFRGDIDEDDDGNVIAMRETLLAGTEWPVLARKILVEWGGLMETDEWAPLEVAMVLARCNATPQGTQTDAVRKADRALLCAIVRSLFGAVLDGWLIMEQAPQEGSVRRLLFRRAMTGEGESSDGEGLGDGLVPTPSSCGDGAGAVPPDVAAADAAAAAAADTASAAARG
jgi:hypothetical protein